MTQTIEIFPTERQILFDKYEKIFEVANYLNRKLVSFQANKEKPIYRWFKYKEGFSSNLVKYFLSEYSPNPGKVLDPFAGAGTALLAAQELGWEPFGIEVLPIGIFIMETFGSIKNISPESLQKIAKTLWMKLNEIEVDKNYISHIPITKYAFSEETEILLNKYLTYCSTIKDKGLQKILRFAAFSILEEISFTRKDGQYLRWDSRSNRELAGKPFDKGKIQSFEEALKHKLNQIVSDIAQANSTSLFGQDEISENDKHDLAIIQGSCLEELPKLDDQFYDFIITSPPYCNRYDYTRTYALELIYLGLDNNDVRKLRQTMLSCTVENKEKIEYLRDYYSSLGKVDVFDRVLKVYNNSLIMTEVNFIIDELNKLGKLIIIIFHE